MVITEAQRFWLESDFVLELLKQIPAYVFWKDKRSVYLGCNNTFAYSLGLSSPTEIIGKTDYDLPTTKEESDSFRIDDKEVMASKKPKLNIEEHQTLPDGRIVTLLTNKVPLLDKQNNVIGILGIYYDITERKKWEEELQKSIDKAEIANKAKTEFLENMRHDIRTPLMGIAGFADIIKSEVSDPKIKEYADNLVASSYSLLHLLNDVLETIKVSSGEIPILKKKFNLQKKLNEVILLNQAKAFEKNNIDLSFHYDPAIPIYLIGDSTRIHRVVLELVTNALNFTHKGYVKLFAQLAKDNEEDVVVKIIVEDTGIGIAPEKQQEIYLQFKRLTPSYEGIYQGYGLGLSIAKQLIDDLQGEIYVESQVGSGTKFTFIVKLKKALLDEALGSEDFTSATGSKTLPLKALNNFKQPISTHSPTTTYKSHILVVEDSPMSAQVVSIMLSTLDCAVDIAGKGRLAVQLAEDKQYDLIFMDIGLPDIDGYETTKRIRLNELKKAHVPIIALTAHAGEDNKKYCIDIGMNAILTKPLIKEKAEDILNSFIPYRREKLNTHKSPGFIAENTHYKELAIFDFELLTKQFRSADVATEMVTLFLENLPQELQELQATYAKKDWPLIQDLTHKLKGGVSYCGAIRLQAACTQLEKAIRNKESNHFENHYDQLLKEIKLTEKTMREKLHSKLQAIDGFLHRDPVLV